MFRKDDNFILQIVFNFENFGAFHFFLKCYLMVTFARESANPGSVSLVLFGLIGSVLVL